MDARIDHLETAGPVTRHDVVVVVPTYNEAATIRSVANAVMATGMRLLVVDDGSPDGTGQIADDLSSDDDRIAVLHRAGKQGLGPAYAAGFATAMDAGAAIVCEMDADLSHDPADLVRLVGAIDEGADVAIGSRYVAGGGTEGWPLHRRWLSRGGNLYARRMLGLGVADATAGFRAYRSEAVRKLDPWSCLASGYGFQIEMTWRAERLGLDIREVPIVFRDRTLGTSKMSTAIAMEAVGLVTRWGIRRMTGRVDAG